MCPIFILASDPSQVLLRPRISELKARLGALFFRRLLHYTRSNEIVLVSVYLSEGLLGIGLDDFAVSLVSPGILSKISAYLCVIMC